MTRASTVSNPNASAGPTHCARPGCGGVASATLSYHYATRTVWLDSAGADLDAGWGLCATHAETLKVPVGWILDDRRPVYSQPAPDHSELDVSPAIAS